MRFFALFGGPRDQIEYPRRLALSTRRYTLHLFSKSLPALPWSLQSRHRRYKDVKQTLHLRNVDTKQHRCSFLTWQNSI
jgi:hypothetical protein